MAIAGYKLQLNGGSFVDEEFDVGYVFEKLFDTGLEPSTEYTVRIAAYDDGDPVIQSEWSAPETFTTGSLALILDSQGKVILDSLGRALSTISA